MRFLIDWFMSWRKTKVIVNAVDRKINTVLKLKAKNDQEVAKAQKKIESLETELLEEIRKWKQLLDNQDTLNRKLSETVDALRDELSTCRDIVIPGLVAANKTFETSWDAQTAQNALMKVSAETKREE